MSILLIPIKIFHAATVMFVICVPFTNKRELLKFHAMALPVIILHWALNSNACCLTLIERSVRNFIYGKIISEQETFIGQFIEPIYDFKMSNENMSNLIYVATTILWSISIYKLYHNL